MIKKVGKSLGRTLIAKESRVGRLEERLNGTGPVRGKRKTKEKGSVEGVPPITP